MFVLNKVFGILGPLLLWCSLCTLAHAEEKPLTDARLSVFLNPAGAPFAFLKEDLSVMHGVDVDIVREIQRRLGFEIVGNRSYPLDSVNALDFSKRVHIDLYGGGLPYNSKFSKELAALPIYLKSSYGVMYSVRVHENIASTKDLKGLKIGVFPGSASINYVYQFEATPVTVSNLSYAVYMVSHGELDALIYDRIVLEDFAKSTQDTAFRILEEEFGKEYCQYTFYTEKLSPYRSLLTRTLQDMIYDGTINRLLRNWGIEVKKPAKRKAGKNNSAKKSS